VSPQRPPRPARLRRRILLLNNVALAAEAALATDGPADITADRVAIIDWDVHHGNGTQETFYDRDDVLFVSAHNDHGSWHPEYHPQEGSIEEFGEGDGEGTRSTSRFRPARVTGVTRHFSNGLLIRRLLGLTQTSSSSALARMLDRRT